jgi:Spy/CpxP family protein refolding chaperone
MMKRLFLLAAVMSLACATNLWACGKAAPGASRTPAANPGRGGGVVVGRFGGGVWGGGKTAAQWYIESIDKIVNLTEAQKKAITASIEARDKAMQEFQTKNTEKLKSAGTSMMEAYKGKDKDAIAKVQKAYQDLYAPMHEAMKKSQAELDNILTAEQKAKLQESRAVGWIKAMTDPVQLSDEQVKKLKAAYGDLTKASDHEAAERRSPKAIDEILTAEQKTTIAKHRAMTYVKSMFAQAKLTNEQMKKIEAMVDEMVKGKGLTFDWQIYTKLAEKARGLLTAEQKAALEARNMLGVAGGAVKALPGGGWQVIVGEGGANRDVRGRSCKELTAKAKRVEQEAHELREAVEQLEGLLNRAQVQVLPGQPLPSQLVRRQAVQVRTDPAIEELRSQVQELRRQVEELKALVKKSGDKK